MKIAFTPEADAASLAESIEEVAQDQSVRGLMLLAGDAAGLSADQVDPLLTRLDLPVLGGIFPEVIWGTQRYPSGLLVIGLPRAPHITLVRDVSDPSCDLEHELDRAAPEIDEFHTVITFVDGFARRIDPLIESIYNVFGLGLNYLGGGAGSLSMQQKPCLFTNEGLLEDAAQLAFLTTRSGLGVRHGWETISGAYRVTDSEHNTVFSLDGKPAFDVYRRAVEDHSGEPFDQDAFFESAKYYPLGISKLGSEYIVRDPFKITEEDGLECVGAVPAGSLVSILTANPSKLIAAAGQASQHAADSFPESATPRSMMFIDCISRTLCLEDHFQDELSAVSDPAMPLFGALTLGEIANTGEDFLEFYNKTAVVGLLED